MNRDNSHNNWMSMEDLKKHHELIFYFFELIDRRKIEWFTHFDEKVKLSYITKAS